MSTRVMTRQIFMALLATSVPLRLAADELGSASPVTESSKVDYRRDVQPVLAKHCYRCHGEDVQEGKLRLDRRESALKGGFHADVIRPGSAELSRLIRYMAGKGLPM